jgi:hypothetical protein
LSELIAPPDIEAIVLNYLRPLLGVTCVTNVPNPRPTSFLVAVAVPSAGIINKGLFESLVSFEAWNVDRVAAGALAREAIARLETAPSFYADCGGAGWLPDPDSGTPRYVFTATIFTRTVLI